MAWRFMAEIKIIASGVRKITTYWVKDPID